ncbi:MAG TPA: DinB family protein [Acidimicrobiales bacterium]|nr:DinB family protein [Acidimicrobiales bacterium]
MKRIDVEASLNETRAWLLVAFEGLSPEQLRRPLTKSEHDPSNTWCALDHFAHLALVEQDFVRMIRRQLAGHANPVGLLVDDNGEVRAREQIMGIVNERTEAFQREHRGDSLSDVVALTARARGETLRLLSELSDSQLEERLEGAPWGDGTLGGVLGANARHARIHWDWATDAGLLEGAG